jgi:hypothetical protein
MGGVIVVKIGVKSWEGKDIGVGGTAVAGRGGLAERSTNINVLTGDEVLGLGEFYGGINFVCTEEPRVFQFSVCRIGVGNFNQTIMTAVEVPIEQVFEMLSH